MIPEDGPVSHAQPATVKVPDKDDKPDLVSQQPELTEPDIPTVPADRVFAALNKKDKDTSGEIEDVDSGTATVTELVSVDEDDESTIMTVQDDDTLPPQSTLLRRTHTTLSTDVSNNDQGDKQRPQSPMTQASV